jgi:hypothetical protein
MPENPVTGYVYNHYDQHPVAIKILSPGGILCAGYGYKPFLD